MTSHRIVSVRGFKTYYAENTASIYRYFTWKDQTGNTVKIVHRIVDDFVVFIPYALEKKYSGCTVKNLL